MKKFDTSTEKFRFFYALEQAMIRSMPLHKPVAKPAFSREDEILFCLKVR
jgi:hypothetical protein